METVYRTKDFPAAERFDRWHGWMSQTHSPVDMTSEYSADFRACTRVLTLGEVIVWPSHVQPLVSRRTAKLIRCSDPETYNLTLILEGAAGASWGDREAEYGIHDLHGQNSSVPCTVWVGRDEPVKSVGVEIPKDAIALPRKSADLAVSRPLSGREGVGALLAGFLTRLCADSSGYRPADGPRLGLVLADLASALFAHVLDDERTLSPEAHRRNLVLRIRAFIDRHVHDPDLSLQSVAAAHHISTSYLHRLFEEEDVTVGALIRRKRLEGARRDLSDPAQREIPVHQVAARWGFSHHSAFTRGPSVPPTAFPPPTAAKQNGHWVHTEEVSRRYRSNRSMKRLVRRGGPDVKQPWSVRQRLAGRTVGRLKSHRAGGNRLSLLGPAKPTARFSRLLPRGRRLCER